MLQYLDLSHIPVVASLPVSQLDLLGKHVRRVRYRRGDCLCRAGDPCRDLGIVLTGLVTRWRVGSDGTPSVIGIVSCGGIVSHAGLRAEAVHECGAEALTRAVVMEIPLDHVRHLFVSSPAFACAMVRAMARQTEAMMTLLAPLRGSVRDRLLYVLRSLVRTAPASTRTDGGYGVTPPLSHADLATLVGVERATVTRAIHGLAAEQFVRVARGHVIGVAMGDAPPIRAAL